MDERNNRDSASRNEANAKLPVIEFEDEEAARERRRAERAQRRGERAEAAEDAQDARPAEPCDGQMELPLRHGERKAGGAAERSDVFDAKGRNKHAARPPLKGITLLGRVFGIVILAILIAHIAIPDREMSTAENRSLQQLPTPSVSSIASGRFQEEFTDYVSDQFPARTLWADAQVAVATLAGGFESNGVYLGSDRTLIQSFEAPEEDAAAAAVAAFKAAYPDMDVRAMVVPTASSLLADRLPAAAVDDDQAAYLAGLKGTLQDAGVEFVDVSGAMAEHVGEGMYYRTDHHWTSLGAYTAFKAAAPQLGISADTAYTPVLLATGFDGSLKTKSGYFFVPGDELSAYVPESGTFDCIITYIDEQRKVTNPYEATALDGTDPYQVFFGGNHPVIRIDSTNLNGRTLLVVKDSYANCFLPFLIDQYQKIVIVDPRYCYDDLHGIVESEGVTETLFLYNATTFAADTSLATMLGVE